MQRTDIIHTFFENGAEYISANRGTLTIRVYPGPQPGKDYQARCQALADTVDLFLSQNILPRVTVATKVISQDQVARLRVRAT